MFSWLEGTQVLKTAEQWLSALKRDEFSIDFTNGKSLLHRGEDPSIQCQYRIEGTNLQERAQIELGVLLSGLQRK